MRARPLAAALLVSIAVGLLARAPYLDAGFRIDDYAMLALLRGDFPVTRSALDLYWFSGATPAENQALRDFGYLPWWTGEDFRLAFLRPLASALLGLDFALFGSDARGYHAHSFVWWALFMSACALVLGRLLPAGTAALAVAAIALDEAHVGPLGWIANRNALISATLAVLALWLHVRGREEGRTGSLALSAGCLALALAGGEYALSLLGYFAAYELLGRPDGIERRVRALAPAAALAVGYLALRAALGYGGAGSALYLDPVSAPGTFAATALPRIAALSGDLVFGVPAIWLHLGTPLRIWLFSLGLFDTTSWQQLPDWSTIQLGIGLCALATAAWTTRWLLRTRAPGSAALRWLVPGTLLSLLPLTAAVPSSRLLEGPELGLAALAAVALRQAATSLRAPRPGTRIAAALGCAVILGVHGGLALAHSASHARDYRTRGDAGRRWARAAELPRDPRADVVVLAAAETTTGTYVPWIRALYGAPLPRSYRVLSASPFGQRVTRLDERTIELRPLANDPRGAFTGTIVRADDDVFRPGERIELPGIAIAVMEVREGNPSRLRFVFDRPLEHPTLVFLSATPLGLSRFSLPAIGEETLVPAAALPWPASAATVL